jgi:hypothetical protein
MLVVHACNLSYSGGRDQKEDRSLKPTWANSSVRPYLEKIHHKKTKTKNSWWSG